MAQPEPVAEPEKAAPVGVKRAGLARPLSDKAKAEAIAEIAARAAALSQVKPAKRRTAENPESRREKEKKRREKMLIEFQTNPEARERYLAQRRESDRQRRARQGSKPRPNGRIENNGLDRRPKGVQC